MFNGINIVKRAAILAGVAFSWFLSPAVSFADDPDIYINPALIKAVDDAVDSASNVSVDAGPAVPINVPLDNVSAGGLDSNLPNVVQPGPAPGYIYAWFEEGKGSAWEGNGVAFIDILFRNTCGVERKVTVSFTVTGLTATKDVDFNLPSGWFQTTIPANIVSVYVLHAMIINDQIVEADEDFKVKIDSVLVVSPQDADEMDMIDCQGAVGSPKIHVHTIVDDDIGDKDPIEFKPILPNDDPIEFKPIFPKDPNGDSCDQYQGDKDRYRCCNTYGLDDQSPNWVCCVKTLKSGKSSYDAQSDLCPDQPQDQPPPPGDNPPPPQDQPPAAGCDNILNPELKKCCEENGGELPVVIDACIKKEETEAGCFDLSQAFGGSNIQIGQINICCQIVVQNSGNIDQTCSNVINNVPPDPSEDPSDPSVPLDPSDEEMTSDFYHVEGGGGGCAVTGGASFASTATAQLPLLLISLALLVLRGAGSRRPSC